MATRAQARYEIRAVDKTRRAFASISRGLKSVGKAALDVTASMAKLTAATAAVGAGALGAFAVRAGQSADEIRRVSTATGESSEAFQRFAAVMNRIGRGDEAAETFRDIAEALGEAKRESTGTKATALQALGLDPQEIKSVDDLMRRLSERFAEQGGVGLEDFFSLRDFSDQAGSAIADIGGEFAKISRITKGTVLDSDELQAGMQFMREIRTIVNEIGQALTKTLLDSGAFKAVADALSNVRDALMEGGIVEALNEALVQFAEKFPRAFLMAYETALKIQDALSTVADIFGAARAAGDMLNRADAAVRGAGESVNQAAMTVWEQIKMLLGRVESNTRDNVPRAQ